MKISRHGAQYSLKSLLKTGTGKRTGTAKVAEDEHLIIESKRSRRKTSLVLKVELNSFSVALNREKSTEISRSQWVYDIQKNPGMEGEMAEMKVMVRKAELDIVKVVKCNENR